MARSFGSFRYSALRVALLATIASGCAPERELPPPLVPAGRYGAEPAGPGGAAPQDGAQRELPGSGLPEPEDPRVAAHCGGGAPVKQRDFGETQVLARDGYALEHSATWKIPLWACEHITAGQLEGDAVRKKSRFGPDPALPRGKRAELTDYRGSGYDRGHHAAAANVKHSQRLMNETFYLSNMAPQVGAGFNRGIWAALEEHVRDLVREHGEAWVVTGGYFEGLGVTTVGKGRVAVPSHFFKVVVTEEEGERRAVAWVLENRRHDGKELEGAQVEVGAVEAATGLELGFRKEAGAAAR